MDHISSLLSKVLKKRGLMRHAEASLLLLRCNAWIAEHLAEHKGDLRAQTFADGLLVIACKNSIASQECRQQSCALSAYLSETCPSVPVEKIRLVREREGT